MVCSVNAPSTEVPVIVIYGKHDNIISVEEELAVLPTYFVDPKIIEMQGSGHYPHIEEPEKVLQILQEELKVHNHQSQN
ncbi:hypothetical protein CTE07_16320 [Chitinophaga terrae (ex Kim and Jung 2007)]|nr:hypothetical protein CTE07_16320 [Chitinophaga terrae (ex Kim and Jung 2007)]